MNFSTNLLIRTPIFLGHASHATQIHMNQRTQQKDIKPLRKNIYKVFIANIEIKRFKLDSNESIDLIDSTDKFLFN